jgi:Raf kinase inhibitor-like YbhB/YbcL family protein
MPGFGSFNMTSFTLRSVFCATVLLAAVVGCGETADQPSTEDDDSDDSDDRETADPSSSQKPDAGGPAKDSGPAAKPIDAGQPVRDAGPSSIDASAPRPEDSGVASARDTSTQVVPVADSGASDAAKGTTTFTLSSSVASDGMVLPKTHRCATSGGENVSPPLAWTSGPAGTLSYALVMRDVTRSSVVLHWFIYDLPASTSELPASVMSGYQPAQPAGAKQGPNYSRALGYQGPCAPIGTNMYEFTLYALDIAQLPSLTESSTGAQIIAQIDMHDLASSKLTVSSSAN